MATVGTVANMIEIAQRRVDQLTTQASGKWSEDWWLGLANEVKNHIATVTLFYNPRQKVQVYQYNQFSDLPANIIGPIKSIFIGSDEIRRMSDLGQTIYDEDWRHQQDWPNQPSGTILGIVSTEAADTGNVTIYGWDTDGLWVQETLALTGTTTADTTEDSWDEIVYVELAAAQTGDVSVMDDDDNVKLIPV